MHKAEQTNQLVSLQLFFITKTTNVLSKFRATDFLSRVVGQHARWMITVGDILKSVSPIVPPISQLSYTPERKQETRNFNKTFVDHPFTCKTKTQNTKTKTQIQKVKVKLQKVKVKLQKVKVKLQKAKFWITRGYNLKSE